MDYYQTLGVEKTASNEDIKRAYRKLAMKHHPDRGGNQEEFQNIQSAYDTLIDEGRRREYDNQQNQPQFQHFHHGGNPFGTGVFDDILRNFGFNFHHQYNHTPPARNRTLHLRTMLSLEEAFTGKTLSAEVKLPSGSTEIINFQIPAGVHDGVTLKVSGVGDNSIPSAPRGDMLLTVNIDTHPMFCREGNDISSHLTIDVFDAILGTTVEVKTIDGKTLEVKIPPAVEYGKIMKMDGYGMPLMENPAHRGKMLIKVFYKIPEKLSPRQIELIHAARQP